MGPKTTYKWNDDDDDDDDDEDEDDDDGHFQMAGLNPSKSSMGQSRLRSTPFEQAKNLTGKCCGLASGQLLGLDLKSLHVQFQLLFVEDVGV